MLLKYENKTSVKGHGRVFIFYMIAKGFYGERGEQKESVDVEPFAIVFRVGVEVEVPHPRLGRQQFESEFAPLAAGRRRARALHAVAVQVDSACSHIEIDPTLIGTQRRITIKIALLIRRCHKGSVLGPLLYIVLTNGLGWRVGLPVGQKKPCMEVAHTT